MNENANSAFLNTLAYFSNKIQMRRKRDPHAEPKELMTYFLKPKFFNGNYVRMPRGAK